METSVKAANMLVAPETDVASSSSPDAGEAQSEPAATPCVDSSSDFFDPMEEFSRRLEDIVGAYSSAASLLDKQNVMDADLEKMKEEPIEDVKVAMETEVSLIMQSLNNSSSPEEKLEDVVRRYAHLAALRRCDENKLCVLQQRLSVLLEEKQQLQAERRRSAATCSKLEALCRELQGHYNILRDETLQRCREDEEKREEMTSHFQTMLTEIQAQIKQHSARNDKLCRENTNLTDKLESLMNQCELREESLEKINRHRDLQHKLTDAKLQQANALLAEAEERHKREKEYLLREAIDKTKKCFAMKEQELDMKKKLTLYSQKFDEFQETLAKSNEIYVRFKKEMENMSDKMKKLEKDSNLWKTRFENCNKALTDMIEERTEKGKEYDLFVLKIQKLEKLCRALQDERKVLYDKIKEVRYANSSLPAKIFGRSKLNDDSADKSGLLTPLEVQELQDEDTVLTEDMARLREEQTKLQEFAASLLDSYADNDEDDYNDIDLEEDLVTAAFGQFKTKTEVKKEPVSVPEEQVVEIKAEAAEPDSTEDQKSDQSTPEENIFEATPTDPQPKDQTPVEDKEMQQVTTNEEIQQQQQQQQPAEQMMTPEAEKVQINPPTDTKPEVAVVQTPVEDKEVQQVRTNEEMQQQQQQRAEPKPEDPKPEGAVVQTPAEDKEVQQVRTNEEIQQQVPTPEAEKAQINPPTDPKPEATEATIAEETGEVTPAEPVEEEKVQQQATESLQESEEASTQSESAPPSKNISKTAASSMKQAPKKKKKKSVKNAS